MLRIINEMWIDNVYQSVEVASLTKGQIIAVLSVTLAIYVALYVLRSIGLYKLALKSNVKNAYIAWIPCVWMYTACKIIGKVRVFGFGNTMDKLAVWACVIFSVAVIVPLVYNFLTYFPYLGYIFQGGTVEFVSDRSGAYLNAGSDFINPFDTEFLSVLRRIFYYFQFVLNLAEIFITVTVYINLFKKFWPEHYILAAVLSFLGLFPIFVFAIRNKNEVDFREYIRRRFYGAGFTPYGRNGFQGGNGGTSDGNDANGKDEPFGEYSNRPDEPFGEFSDDKKDDGKDDFN